MKDNITIIVARDLNGLIGSHGEMPWDIPEELALFKETTMGHNVIMGRKTYESLGKPLTGRVNYVLSKSIKDPDTEEVKFRSGFGEIMFDLIEKSDELFFVIGGKEIYDLFLPLANRLLISELAIEAEGDTYFPKVSLGNWTLIKEQKINNSQNIEVIRKEYARKKI